MTGAEGGWCGQGCWAKNDRRALYQERMSTFRLLVDGQHRAKVSCYCGGSMSIRPCGFVKNWQAQTAASETSYVSFARLDDPWPS